MFEGSFIYLEITFSKNFFMGIVLNRKSMLDVDSTRAVKWEYDRLVTVKRADIMDVTGLPASPFGSTYPSENTVVVSLADSARRLDRLSWHIG
jgi:hypothetical protein